MGSASNAAVSPGRALNWCSCGFRSLQQYQQRQTLPPHRQTMSTTTTMCPSLTASPCHAKLRCVRCHELPLSPTTMAPTLTTDRRYSSSLLLFSITNG